MRSQSVLYICFFLFCVNGQIAKKSKTSPFSTTISDSVQSFAMDLFRNIGPSSTSSNTLVSPLNLFTALSMASMGARGSTLEQIQRVLHLSPDPSFRKRGIASLLAAMRNVENEGVQLDTVNLIWVPRGVSLKSDYAQSVQEIFQTKVRDADFTRPEEVRQLVNRRISTFTKGHVKELLPRGSITSETRLLLANALYFKGQWMHPFSHADTYPEPFFTDEGTSFHVHMMHASAQSFRGGVFEELNAKAIYMPYEDNRFGFLCILPDRNYGLDDLERRLWNNSSPIYSPTRFLRRMIHRDVNVTLPRFKIQFDMEMSNVFQKMGIHDLFSSNADLSGMSSSATSKRLKVSSVYHQATIEVNESGSEASAVSGFEITPLMGGAGKFYGPMDFRADRPFLFYIIDRDNENIPVFAGRVQNPQEYATVGNTNDRNKLIYGQPNPEIMVHKNHNIATSRPLHHLENYLGNNYAQRTTTIRPTYPQQPPRNRPGSFVFNSGSAPHSYYNYYNPYRRVSTIDSSLSSGISSSSGHQDLGFNPILFPDEEEFVSRFKRNVQTFNATSSISQAEDVDTRLKDNFWFKKPTAPEVILNINSNTPVQSTFSNNNFPQSQPLPPPIVPNIGDFLAASFNRPDAEQVTSTVNPLVQSTLSTNPQNIFHALTVAPSRVTPALNNNENIWNHPEKGGPPGFLPANSPSNSATATPTILSHVSAAVATWQGSPSNFPPFINSGSPVFFPEFRNQQKGDNSPK